jgi:translocation and assembly module TamA
VSWVREFNELPPSVRFFTGGDFSVRGYEYNSLGPKDSNGNVIGGRHLIVGSVEYDHPIIEKWRGAIFYDIGNAINHLSDPLFDSAGIGIRWKSPVGLFRLDVARPLAGDDRSLRLHITFGPDL